jgi:hypothetical protein
MSRPKLRRRALRHSVTASRANGPQIYRPRDPYLAISPWTQVTQGLCFTAELSDY